MTLPEPNYPVNEEIQTATKAVVATVTTLGTFLALFLTDIGDGSIGSGEVGGLVTAGLGAIATITGVWTFRNRKKL